MSTKSKSKSRYSDTIEIVPEISDQKQIVYPIEDIFVGNIKEKDEISEYTILYKKKDDNGNITYQDLISRETYTQEELKENNIEIPRRTTLLTVINERTGRFNSSLYKKIEECMKKGYITSEILVMINSELNKDTYYYENWGEPYFCKQIENGCVYDKNDEALTKLLIVLTTSKKIPILTGDTGIGKTTYANKIFHFKTLQSSYFTSEKIYHANYEEGFRQRLTTIGQRKNRISKTFNTLRKDTLLFIDDVDFNDHFFLNELAKNIENLKSKIVLISKNKINKENIDSNFFTLIEVPKQKEEIQNKVIENTITELEAKTTLSLNLDEEDKKELIKILLNTDQTNSINDTFDHNPNLAKVIVTNAFKLATAFQQDKVTLHNFIEALSLDNVNMAPDSKNNTTKSLNDLVEKVENRKEEEEEKRRQLEEQAKTKTFGFRLKNMFNKNK